jgi:hypothetical protein
MYGGVPRDGDANLLVPANVALSVGGHLDEVHTPGVARGLDGRDELLGSRHERVAGAGRRTERS